MQQQVPQETNYFIPPPMGNATKTYFQQLQASDSSIRNLTQNLRIFEQQLLFDNNPIASLVETNVTPQLRDRLRIANLAIYKHLREYLGAIVSEIPTRSPQALDELKRKLFEYNMIVGGLKVFETRMEVLKLMEMETVTINKRTAQIQQQLEEVKADLRVAGVDRVDL